jgi:hypothetical protein
MDDGADSTGGDVFGGMVVAHAHDVVQSNHRRLLTYRVTRRGADDASSTIQIVRIVPFAPFGPTTSTSTE